MPIAVGDRLPEITFTVMGPDGPAPMTVAQVFAGKKIALFAVPGAYTPTCHKNHMPGFLARLDEIKAKGIDTIACTAVNDVYVFTNWAKDTGAEGKVLMLSDGSANFARAVGLDNDSSAFGMGIRSKRYAMLVEDGIVKVLNVEDAPPQAVKSSAEALCSAIDRSI